MRWLIRSRQGLWTNPLLFFWAVCFQVGRKVSWFEFGWYYHFGAKVVLQTRSPEGVATHINNWTIRMTLEVLLWVWIWIWILNFHPPERAPAFVGNFRRSSLWKAFVGGKNETPGDYSAVLMYLKFLYQWSEFDPLSGQFQTKIRLAHPVEACDAQQAFVYGTLWKFIKCCAAGHINVVLCTSGLIFCHSPFGCSTHSNMVLVPILNV